MASKLSRIAIWFYRHARRPGIWKLLTPKLPRLSISVQHPSWMVRLYRRGERDWSTMMFERQLGTLRADLPKIKGEK